MDATVVVLTLLGAGVLLVVVVTAIWLLGGFEGTAASRRRLERMEVLRTRALDDAGARGHEVVGPAIDAWLYSCARRECLGTVGIVLDDRGRPVAAGTALEHDCPTAVATPWDAPTHHRHGGPAHDH